MRTPVLLLAFALLTPRLAAAQDYQWTDERGSVHFASDPSEVPARFRENAVRDALKREQSKPAAPAAAAPESGSEIPAAPRYRDPRQISPEQMQRKIDSNRIGRQAEQDAAAARAHQKAIDDQEEAQRDQRAAQRQKEKDDEGRPAPREGSHRECWNVVYSDGSKGRECRDMENGDRLLARHDRAREKALDKLGVTEEEAAKDPELQKKLDKLTNKNIERAMKSGDAEDDDSDD